MPGQANVDCEQCLFSFRLGKGRARARAWSFSCLARFARRTKKKKTDCSWSRRNAERSYLYPRGKWWTKSNPKSTLNTVLVMAYFVHWSPFVFSSFQGTSEDTEFSLFICMFSAVCHFMYLHFLAPSTKSTIFRQIVVCDLVAIK